MRSKVIAGVLPENQPPTMLPENGALQRAIFNSANFSSIATDAKGIIQIFNVGAERMLGYAAADVMNKSTPADLSDPQELVERAKALSRELETPIAPGFEALVFKASRGIEDIYELTYIRKDGSRFPAVVSVTALRNAQDAIIGYLLIGTDNTERKRLETRFNVTVESAPIAMVMVDRTGCIKLVNRLTETLFGYHRDELLGQSVEILLPKRYCARHPGLRDGFFHNPSVRRMGEGRDLYGLRKNGSEFPVEIGLSPVETSEGQFVLGTIADITERKHAENKLERSSTLLRTIVETAPGPIYAKDRNGCMLLANAGTLKLIGKTWTEVEGQTDLQLLADPVQAAVVMANDRRIMETGQVEELEELVEDRDGAVRVWLSTKTPIHDPGGQVSGLVGVSVEITELKRRSDQLTTLNAALNVALTDRTAALQQRDMLLREVYHRVKNNLQMIDGFVVMQARQMEDQAGKAALLSLRNRLHALALVHHQLMHSENLRTFDIAPFLHEVADNILQGVGDDVQMTVRTISLDVDLDFAIPLGLLVAELVTNSLKHAFPNGKGTITVSLEHAAEGAIALIVSDDGQGRIGESIPHGQRKVGLGAGIIKGMVGQLQGELTVKNENGTRTEIRVPAPVIS
jgi:PAS domain S-box-containing protein